MAELFFWPALLFYGEAAVGYFGEARHPGTAGRAATWGVRLGWLAQTALLVYQATRDDGFPWGTWAGSLNLFVWLVVTAYLIWGCRRSFRLLGLTVMPFAVALLVVARAGGGTGTGSRSRYSTAFLVLHVGLVLVAFAGFTLAAGLSALYLWQERRLKRRETTILRRPAPSLATLDRTRAAHGLGVGAGADAGDRRRGRASHREQRPRRRSRRRDRRHVGRLGRVPRPAHDARLDREARRISRARRLPARDHRPSRPPGHPLRLMRLVLVGTSHHHAPVELRERVALDRERSAALAAQLAEGGCEAVCLSTCNRTELYVACLDPEAAERAAVAALAELEPAVEQALYRLRDQAAGLHLFRVAAGLDSLVPGEGEILGQVRAAYEAGTTGMLLDRLFRQALHVGRKVRAQTAIAESPASVSSAAAALAEQVFGDLDGRSILLLGAGKISEQAARNLASRGANIAFVANRTLDRATELASRFGAAPLPLEQLAEELVTADLVVSSTGAPGYVLDAATVATALGRRRGRQLLLIDLAVPRDLDPAIHELDGCYLYDIDDLEAIVAETLVGRRREAERAESMVAAEAAKFHEWHASLDVVPAIASLRARAEEIREAELRKADGVLGRLDESQRKAVESITAQIVNKLLHLPTVRMKQAAAAADGVVYADAVRHLFGLGEDER